MAVAGPGVEQRIAAEQRGLVSVGQQADVAHRMPGRIQRLQLNGFTYPDNIPCLQALVDTGNGIPRVGMGQQTRASRGDQRAVAAGMIGVFVGVEHLGDIPAEFPRPGQAFLVVQRVDGHGLAGFGAGDQVVEIAVGVSSPNLFNNHDGTPGSPWYAG